MKIYNSSSTFQEISNSKTFFKKQQMQHFHCSAVSYLTSDCLLFHTAQEAAIIMHANVVMLPGFTCDLP